MLPLQAEWVTMNYVPFGEKSLNMTVSLYQKTAQEPAVIEGGILKEIIETLHIPLGMKYSCPSPSTWKLAVNSLLTVLLTGLPLARKQPEHFKAMWPELASTLDHFLFPNSPPVDRIPEDIRADEGIDCKVIELLRDEVMPHSSAIPKDFVLQVIVLLNKGSIHSASASRSSGLVDRSAWEQLIGLYPYLVDCTATASPQVSNSLREALLQYSDLLQPPGLPNGV
ncbi:hypothetical protein J437_LFUL014167 [Ladona fulva]|uniref:Mon2 C-terminal domain-containing protein n=1 Tax=Ladona fulva TaxID=123851 RepID=A0A8K0KA05_LADFU|nr:hypothetical protein J437_LFUL014167 [Ladona fulva]